MHKHSSQIHLSTVALGILAAVFFVDSLKFIIDSLPYSQNWDDRYTVPFIAKIAFGYSLKPELFTYPTLPLYLGAIAMLFGRAVTFLTGADTPVVLQKDLWYPTFHYAFYVGCARVLFLALGTAAALLLADIARRFTGNRLASIITFLLVISCPTFVIHSRQYVNVDIAGLFFVVLCVWQLTRAEGRDDFRSTAVLPGIWAGMAIACKYQLGLVLVPCVCVIVLSKGDRRRKRIGFLLATACAAFLLSVPYFIIEFPKFVVGIGYTAGSYARGFAVHGESGFPQLQRYLLSVLETYGRVFFVVGGVGMCALARRDSRRCLLLSSFPLALVAFMSCMREYNWRSILPVYALFAVFVAYGVTEIAGRIGPATPLRFARFGNPLLIGAIAAIGLFAMDWNGLRDTYRRPPDSRIGATGWMKQNLPRKTPIWISQELALASTSLIATHDVRSFVLEDLEKGWEPCGVVVVPEASVRHQRPLATLLEKTSLQTVASFPGMDLPENPVHHYNSPGVRVVEMRGCRF